jgi:hypothetical protein
VKNCVNLADRRSYVCGRIVLQILIVLAGMSGAHIGALFEALRYKPEGCGIDSQWCHWNFSLT